MGSEAWKAAHDERSARGPARQRLAGVEAKKLEHDKREPIARR